MSVLISERRVWLLLQKKTIALSESHVGGGLHTNEKKLGGFSSTSLNRYPVANVLKITQSDSDAHSASGGQQGRDTAREQEGGAGGLFG